MSTLLSSSFSPVSPSLLPFLSLSFVSFPLTLYQPGPTKPKFDEFIMDKAKKNNPNISKKELQEVVSMASEFQG